MTDVGQRPSDLPATYCSDVDGVRYIVIDPTAGDMSGWIIETTDGDGRVSRSAFTREATWYETQDGDWNGLGYGTPKNPWAALVDRGMQITNWIRPVGAP
ncbi:hypothetical protein [Rhodococcus tukisamuensis]|uniref:Uncharacterized protein n=1 Tax=Rhodococcus tukisamuensis TaxID=168276 RepID=A0A1G6Z7U5_9NOCA|nr:hypothetical protein [Rhodococcus tukisamuensis]SDD98718.1 hypothetical protein SAMN05444580_108142 [Rhodococcus tukisamuensis]